MAAIVIPKDTPLTFVQAVAQFFGYTDMGRLSAEMRALDPDTRSWLRKELEARFDLLPPAA